MTTVPAARPVPGSRIAPGSPGRAGIRTARSGRTAPAARPATAGMLAAAVVALAASGLARHHGGAVLLAGVAIGLPHGAADHVSVAWSAGRRVRGATAARTAAAYLAGIGATAAVLAVSTAGALAALLAVSAAHFGTSDPAPARRGALGRVAPLSLGALPVAGPLAFHPGRSSRLVAHLAPALGHAVAAPAVTGGLAAMLCVAVLATAALAWRAGERLLVAELAVLAGAVTLLPPLAAFGAYFGLWHAPRHVARLAGLGRAVDRRPLLRLAGWAVPTTAATVAAAAAAWALLPHRLAPVAALAGLLAVAVPHAVVVARLPRRPAWQAATGAQRAGSSE